MGFNKKFLSRQEAADALGISLVTLARRLRDQSIPYVKIGARVLIPAAFIDQLLEKALSEREVHL
jgi:excisionase family DNA binding protein